MTTTESDALLAAVLSAPEDDAPRLIYADWLDENGRPERAQFIRLQVERSRLPRYDPRREVFTRRADALFDRYGADWVAELPRADGITWAKFDRGFPRAIVARTLASFERAAGRLAAAAPIDTLELRAPEARRLARAQARPALRVLRVRHSGLADPPDELFQSPLVSSLHTLDLVGLGLENDGLAALARSGRLESLRELVLDGNLIGTAGLVALAGARALRNLTRLSIRGEADDEYGDDPVVRSEGVEALAGSHVFASLEALDLAGNQIDDEALAYIVQSPHLVNLRELSLADNDLTADGLEILEESGWEVRLESLDLSRNPVGDAGARRLAESEVCNELVRLTLDGCEIGTEGAEAVARADWFPALRALSLNDNAIGPALRALAAVGASLGELRVRGNEVGSAGARAMAGSKAMAELVILDVSSNGLGSDGVQALGASPHLTGLAILDVGYNGMPKEAGLVEPAVGALRALAPGLVYLRLDGNFLGTPGVLGLVMDVEWPRLAELGVRYCGINAPALAYLAADGRFPALTRLGLSLNVVDPTGLKDLLRAPFVAGVSHLDLASNHLSNDGARLLADADLNRLRWLSVEANNIRGPGFNALVRSTRLPRLRTLRYGGNPAGDWWRQLPDRFPGDEVWVEPASGDDDSIPF